MTIVMWIIYQLYICALYLNNLMINQKQRNMRVLTSVALLIITHVVLLTIKKWKNHKKVCQNLPPGPKKLPIIGDLHRLSATPFRSFRDLAETHGPLMHLKLGQVPVIIVSSPEMAKLILRDYDPCFAARPRSIALEIAWYNYVSFAFSDYCDYWKQMRKICIMKLLGPKKVRSYGYIRREEVSRLVQEIKLSSEQPINLTQKIFATSTCILCRASFGRVCKDSDTMIALVRQALDMVTGFCISDLFPNSKIIKSLDWHKVKLVKMRCKVDAILDDVISEHKLNIDKHENEDLVDAFLRFMDKEELQFPFNSDNIKAILLDLLAGGTDTSSTTIDWAMTELIRNPRVMAKAQAEIREAFKGIKIIEENDLQKLTYLKLVVKETLRLHAPAPLVIRASRHESSINGYVIPAKAKVLVNTWAMQRDPKYWINPESFEPERFENKSVDFTGGNFEFVPFGAGKRMCPAMAFGLANIELILARLLYSFNWKLPEGKSPNDLNMIESFGVTASRKDNLYVVATPYV